MASLQHGHNFKPVNTLIACITMKHIRIHTSGMYIPAQYTDHKPIHKTNSKLQQNSAHSDTAEKNLQRVMHKAYLHEVRGRIKSDKTRQEEQGFNNMQSSASIVRLPNFSGLPRLVGISVTVNVRGISSCLTV